MGARLKVNETDYREGLAVAYIAEANRFHRAAASALISAGYHDPVHSAADVVNQAIMSLIEHPVDSVDNYAAIIMTAIRRRAIDLSRSAAKTKRREDAVLGLPATDAGHEFSKLEDAIDAERTVERIRSELDRLGARERYVVEAIAIRGEAQTDVAARLGISKQRVAQIYGTVKAALREAVNKTEGCASGDG